MKNVDEFWANCERQNNGCWIWQGAVDTRGYGHFRWEGKLTRAHRFAFQMVQGEIPKMPGYHGAIVMHTCDNRLCCNPDHLRVGTHADNMADMKAKGRRKGIGTGIENGRAKLTADQVSRIRADTRGKRTIAPEYGISPAQVQRIRTGQQWSANS